MLPRDCLAIQFTSFDELVDSTLWGGVEVAHDHAQGIAVTLAHNVVHDIQQRPQLGNLHAEKEHHNVQHCVTGSSSVRGWDLQAEKEHRDVQHYVRYYIQQRLQFGPACREGTLGCAALCQG